MLFVRLKSTVKHIQVLKHYWAKSENVSVKQMHKNMSISLLSIYENQDSKQFKCRWIQEIRHYYVGQGFK